MHADSVVGLLAELLDAKPLSNDSWSRLATLPLEVDGFDELSAKLLEREDVRWLRHAPSGSEKGGAPTKGYSTESPLRNVWMTGRNVSIRLRH